MKPMGMGRNFATQRSSPLSAAIAASGAFQQTLPQGAAIGGGIGKR
jgi:hypothetical protein